MLGATLIRYQVVEVRQPGEKRLLASLRVVKAFHREQFPLDGVMRLIQQGAGGRHLRVFEHGIPACFLLPKPVPDACAVGFPGALCHAVGKVAEPLPQRKHPPAFALAGPGQQGVDLGAQGLADRGGDGHEFAGQLVDRVAETVTSACSREQRPHTYPFRL